MKLLPLRFCIACIFYCVSVIGAKAGSVKVYRDSMGVAHVFASTNSDALFGLAYAHAQDNFPAIERMMILSRARLGELEGWQGLKSDFFVNFLNARHLVKERMASDFSPEFLSCINAYAQGLNRYVRDYPNEVRLKGVFPVDAVDIATAYVVIFSSMTGVAQALSATLNGSPEKYVFGARLGSNAAAVSPAFSDDSSTFLFANPHVPLEGPLSWYEAHIVSDEGLNFHGCLFPGMVSPAMGSSEHHAWAITFNWPDYVDIHELKMVNRRKLSYRFDGSEKKLQLRKSSLSCKFGGFQIRFKRRFFDSVYGPVIQCKKRFFAFQINSLDHIQASEQFFKMAIAKSFSDFQKALSMQSVPLFNIVYADNAGNISYLFNGKIPRRSTAFDWQSLLPGDTSATLWNGYLSLSELPSVTNPSSGFVYNTNNSPFFCSGLSDNPIPSDFHPCAGWHWNRVNARDLRFRELVANRSSLSFDQFVTIKYDCCYPKADCGVIRSLKPLFNLTPDSFPAVADIIRHAQKWNFSGDASNKHAALVLLTFIHLNKLINAGYIEMETGLVFSQKQLLTALKLAASDLRKSFGTLDVELGKVQVIERKGIVKPVSGLPDGLSSAYLKKQKNNRYKVVNGDTFIMFCKFPKHGKPSISSVLPYGVSARPDSPFFCNQMEYFSERKTKPVFFSEDVIQQNAISLSVLIRD